MLLPRGLIALLTVIASLGVLASTAGSADAYVYWGNTTGFSQGSISRARNDGSHVREHLVPHPGAVGAIAVAGRQIYWIDADAERIGRARIDGSHVRRSFIPVAGQARDLAVSGDRIYWTIGTGIGSSAAIARARIDGSDVDLSFIPIPDANYGTPTGIDVAGDRIFWANAYPVYAIARAMLDGSGVEQEFITSPDLRNPSALAADGRHIFFSNRAHHTIAGADFDGGNLDLELITGVGDPSGLAVDSRHRVLWQTSGGIYRARGNGSRVRRLFDVRGVATLAVDDRGPSGHR